MARIFRSWVDGFLAWTDGQGSPELFRKWGAISAIAGALERKVWTFNRRGRLYPNFYIFLVAPPGVGKSLVTKRVHKLWSGLEGFHIAPSNASKAALIDSLKHAQRSVYDAKAVPPQQSYNALLVSSNELVSFMPSYDGEFMGFLTDIWDGDEYRERKRTREVDNRIERPYVNMLAATATHQLYNLLPDTAWDGGFMARVILVYSAEVIVEDIFATEDENGQKEQEEALQADLEKISKIQGQYRFEPAALDAIRSWYLPPNEQAPRPEHPKLINYTTRRIAHLNKLCMVAAADESNSLNITLDHFNRAKEWLLEVERFMPDIFKASATAGASDVINDTYYYAVDYWKKKQEPIPEALIVQFISQKAPVYAVNQILDVMKRAKFVSELQIQGVGVAYKPRVIQH